MQTNAVQGRKSTNIVDAKRADDANIGTIDIVNEVDNKTDKRSNIEDKSGVDDPDTNIANVDKADNSDTINRIDEDKAE